MLMYALLVNEIYIQECWIYDQFQKVTYKQPVSFNMHPVCEIII